MLPKEIANELRNQGFNPVTPPELKAKPTIITTKLDNHIYQDSIEEIAPEIIDNNEGNI
ncbi:hypothetical protein E2C01_057282 [Portunus trituberculatus]|uniref:Uncharacterized protein n=1 Tax=Portunus trituberculatus TaxID=210409 RepID=A0A5B7H1Y5_PORTR|nr:hypothetical protein [Portunus trituberculatus]